MWASSHTAPRFAPRTSTDFLFVVGTSFPIDKMTREEGGGGGVRPFRGLLIKSRTTVARKGVKPSQY